MLLSGTTTHQSPTTVMAAPSNCESSCEGMRRPPSLAMTPPTGTASPSGRYHSAPLGLGATDFLTMTPQVATEMALNVLAYSIDQDGCPGDKALVPGRGGWLEDAHFDKVHNYMDALAAFPAWGR